MQRIVAEATIQGSQPTTSPLTSSLALVELPKQPSHEQKRQRQEPDQRKQEEAEEHVHALAVGTGDVIAMIDAILPKEQEHEAQESANTPNNPFIR